METKIKNYLNKTSKHLFVIGDDTFYKVLPITHENKLYALTLKFKWGSSKIQTVEVQKYINWYDGNALCEFKKELFTEGGDHHAIKHFKAMRELLSKIEDICIHASNKRLSLEHLTDNIKECLTANAIEVKTEE